MIDKLIQFDISLFLFLNGIRNPFFDFVFWWASHALVWLPVYITLLYFVIRVYRKQAIIVIIFVGLCIAITDMTSYYLLKETIMRFRPTHNPEIQLRVQTINGYIGGLYGFVSSHAANYFGLAVFLSVLFFRKIRFFIPVVLLWAAIISYSRIYLGVHYPADIFFGALLGVIIGLTLGLLFKNLSVKVLQKKTFFKIPEETN